MDNINNKSQDNQLITFVVLGLVFGAFGAHDFYIEKKRPRSFTFIIPDSFFNICLFLSSVSSI